MQVFISYPGAAKIQAHEIARTLNSYGYESWIAPESIPANTIYTIEIARGLQSSDLVILVYDHTANHTDWVLSEITIAHNNHKEILVLRLDDSPYGDALSVMLTIRQAIDGFTNYLKGVDELVNAVHKFFGIDPAENSNKEIHQIRWWEQNRETFEEMAANYVNNGEYLNLAELFVSPYLKDIVPTLIYDCLMSRDAIGETYGLPSVTQRYCGTHFPHLERECEKIVLENPTKIHNPGIVKAYYEMLLRRLVSKFNSGEGVIVYALMSYLLPKLEQMAQLEGMKLDAYTRATDLDDSFYGLLTGAYRLMVSIAPNRDESRKYLARQHRLFHASLDKGYDQKLIDTHDARYYVSLLRDDRHLLNEHLAEFDELVTRYEATLPVSRLYHEKLPRLLVTVLSILAAGVSTNADELQADYVYLLDIAADYLQTMVGDEQWLKYAFEAVNFTRSRLPEYPNTPESFTFKARMPRLTSQYLHAVNNLFDLQMRYRNSRLYQGFNKILSTENYEKLRDVIQVLQAFVPMLERYLPEDAMPLFEQVHEKANLTKLTSTKQ